MNFFQLFNLEETYALDLDALEIAYLKAQQEAHPDQFSGLSSQENIQYLQKSADINDAYACLKDDVKRAIHLLGLNGQANVLKETSVPHELLQTQFDWRERSEEEDRVKLLSALKKKIKDTKIELSSTFVEKDFAQGKFLTLELHFFKKLEKELKRRR